MKQPISSSRMTTMKRAWQNRKTVMEIKELAGQLGGTTEQTYRHIRRLHELTGKLLLEVEKAEIEREFGTTNESTVTLLRKLRMVG